MNLLRECQQGIERLQIRWFHHDRRRGRKFRTGLRQRDHRIRGQGGVAGQEYAERIVDGILAVVSRLVQDLQVVLDAAPFVATLAEPVVGKPEPRRREQIVAIGVVRECARLADQRIDDVPVIHRVPVATHQPRQGVDQPVRVPDLDAVRKEPGFHPLADQPAVHRIDVTVNVNQAAAVHPARHLQTRRQPRFGQEFQRRHLLGEAIGPARVPRPHDLLQERDVLVPVRKVAAAAEEQRLIDRGLEVPMRRLRIAVLVRLPRVDPLTRYAVVCQQVAVAGLELPRRREIVHGRAQTVAPVPTRHAAQFPECILQAVGQRLERLRGTQRHRLPVRVGQHEMVHQVIEPPAGDRDVQRVHVREVGGREIAGVVDLTEHDGLPRPVRRPPLPHAALEGAAMRIEELPGMLATQPVEERLREQPRFGRELLLDRGPDRRKRIGPGPVRPRPARRLPCAGQRTQFAIVTGRLVAHSRSPGRTGQAHS
jgi:hypothetical protein